MGRDLNDDLLDGQLGHPDEAQGYEVSGLGGPSPGPRWDPTDGWAALDALGEQIGTALGDDGEGRDLALVLLGKLKQDPDRMDAIAEAWLADEAGTVARLDAAVLQISQARSLAKDLAALCRRRSRSLEQARRQAESQRSVQRELGRIDRSVGKTLGVKAWEGLPQSREWPVYASGVFRVLATDEGERLAPVCPWPIVPTAVLTSADGATESLRVEWLVEGDPNRRRAAEASAATWFNARSITSLADQGVPVGSANAKAMAEYLFGQATRQRHNLRSATITDHLGWQGKEGDQCFVLGSRVYTRDGVFECDDIVPSKWPEGLVMPDAACRQIGKRFKTTGTFEGWCAMWEKVRNRPTITAGVFASIAPLLLGVIPEAPNFIFEWASRNGTGKSTAMAVAASAWGSHNLEEGPACVVEGWNNTRVWMESFASRMRHLPLLMDDTKGMGEKSEHVVGELVYGIANGSTRGRADVNGQARERTRLRTGLVSTGEVPCHTYANGDGAKARSIVIESRPLGEQSIENAELAVWLSTQTRLHHGHLADLVIRHLVENQHTWHDLRVRYAKLATELRAAANGKRVSGRLASTLALLGVAEDLCFAVGVPLSRTDFLTPLLGTAELADAEADLGERAYEVVTSWFGMSRSMFLRGTEPDDARTIPPRGDSWLGIGVWNNTIEHPKLVEIVIVQAQLRAVLEREGMNSREVMIAWRDAGRIRCEQNRFTRKAVADRVEVRGVVLAL